MTRRDRRPSITTSASLPATVTGRAHARSARRTMGRAAHLLFTFLAIVSMALCVAASLAWKCNPHRQGGVMFPLSPSSMLTAWTPEGRICLRYFSEWDGPRRPRVWHAQGQGLLMEVVTSTNCIRSNDQGFAGAYGFGVPILKDGTTTIWYSKRPIPFRELCVPSWLFVAVTAVLPFAREPAACWRT